ncbi:transcriptional regulator NanR [Cypionkella sp.]|uniref:transcriptional regulator NanR n=1 Tax=Cypionkella sp. TaxID=2811411 RepID=UPI002623FCC5|nr:transcriptional regulator NanR [Cypionkella sp.]MDB5663711.1 transcriptional regulator NanR [Cypionkella sp.]
MSSEKITRQKLSDQVFDRLRAMILTGELAAGEVVPSERALMLRFGVGRPAVREALQQMHTMGLITIAHGERSRVKPLNAGAVLGQVDAVAQLLLSAEPGALAHLKEARRLFESGMVRIAAARAVEADVVDLSDILDEQRRCLADPRAFIAADMAFHTRIAAMTANPIMLAVSQAMLKWLFHYHSALLHWSGKEEVTLLEHARIIERIAARDGDGAVAAMQAHIARSADVIAHH